MYSPGETATWPYLRRLFEDPANPVLLSFPSNALEGSFSIFGFPFLRAMLEIGQETGTLVIHGEEERLTAHITLEKGQVREARLDSNPFLSREGVLQFFERETPGAHRFRFDRNRRDLPLVGVV